MICRNSLSHGKPWLFVTMKTKLLVVCLTTASLLLADCGSDTTGGTETGGSSATVSSFSVEKSVTSEAQTSYKVTSSKIEIGSTFKLNGILCMPEGVENPPVVVMVQGSGQSDYDETISANKPFRDIAEGLAKHGVASICYNKRYYQYAAAAAEKVNTLTIQDEVTEDVGEAIAFAKQHEATSIR